MLAAPQGHLISLNDDLSMLPALPVLTATPTSYAGCCLALSAPLIAWLRNILPSPPNLVLSIGSGYGLLEAILIHPPYSLKVIGVEVHPTPNIYLPNDHHRCVFGSRFLDSIARHAKAWLFVYPRRPGLFQEYLSSDCEHVAVVVWIGPHADWVDYEQCLSGIWTVTVQSANLRGGRSCDLIAVAKKNFPQVIMTAGISTMKGFTTAVAVAQMALAEAMAFLRTSA